MRWDKIIAGSRKSLHLGEVSVFVWGEVSTIITLEVKSTKQLDLGSQLNFWNL